MFTLNRTSGACPEQYDVFLKSTGEKVGYLRLRHGYFRAECHGEDVYDANTRGDGLFEDDEREIHLANALRAIQAKLSARAAIIDSSPLYDVEGSLL